MGKRLAWIFTLGAILMTGAATVNAHNWLGEIFTGGRQIHGSGNLESETRDVSRFTRIEIAMGVDVTVHVGKPQQVTVTFDDNVISTIQTRVHAGTLTIDSKRSFSSDADCHVDICVPELSGFDLFGSGDVQIEDLNGDRLQLGIYGSGNIVIDGKAQWLKVALAGSGSVDARDLLADDAEVEISGSGNVQVNAVSRLEASISGSGDIAYYGDPEDVDSDVAGSGSIHRVRGKR